MSIMIVVKIIHVSCALMAISGIIIRGILMMKDSPLLTTWAAKKLPHIIDTVLFISAIILASQWGWLALEMPWLLAKIAALLVYIGCGTIALRFGRSKSIRITAFLGAICAFAYIVAVAATKNPLLIF